MGAEKYGDWAKLERMFAGIGERFKANVREATDQIGHLIETTAVKHIESQDLGWPPLSEKYRIRKMLKTAGKLRRMSRAKLSGRLAERGLGFGATESKGDLALRLAAGGNQLLIDTGKLISGIRYRTKQWDRGAVTVIRKAGETNIAAVHEFGSSKRKIPARPFMAPTETETAPRVVSIYQEAVEKTFK